MKRLLVIVGPTGSGKTQLALRFASSLHCPIINADSRQIYHDLPIGTAAPTSDELKQIPHYGVGTKTLTETYNAGQFARDCRNWTTTLFPSHDTLVMVGGSMLYVEAVCRGLDDIPSVPEAVRLSVQRDYAEKGLSWLQAQVQRIDPDYWQIVDTNNPQRLMHCLEVYRTTSQPISAFRGKGNRDGVRESFTTEWHLIELPRTTLYERINTRVDEMVKAGLEQEAKQAFERLGIDISDKAVETQVLPNSVNTVGYKEMLNYFRGVWTRDKAIEMIKQNTRHYAKRQMTWWRNRI